MALQSDYTSGTISVAVDGTAVTGVGTGWQAAGFREGDLLFADGYTGVVKSVESNTALTLDQPWRGGALSGAFYRLRYQSDGSRFSAQARALIEMLGGSGNLEALGGLQGAPNLLAYFTGAGQMDLTEFTAAARELLAGDTDDEMLTALGFSAFMAGLRDDADDDALLASLGFSTFMAGLRDEQDDDTLLVALGFSEFMAGLRTAADQAAARTALGAQEELGFTPVNKAGDVGVGALSMLGATLRAATAGVELGLNFAGTSGIARGRLGYRTANDTMFLAMYNATGAYVGSIDFDGVTTTVRRFVVGTGNNETKLTVNSYGDGIGYGSSWRQVATNATSHRFLNIDGVENGTITHTPTSTGFNTASDYRLKPDAESLTPFTLGDEDFDYLPNNLLKVMATRPVRYHWLGDEQGDWNHGFLAHELQQVFPHAVYGEKDAVELIGEAVIPGIVFPADPENGQEEPEIVPERRFDAIPESEAPEGSTWTQTGERILPQQVDYSKLVADLTAAVQELTLLVLEQRRDLASMADRVSLLEAQ